MLTIFCKYLIFRRKYCKINSDNAADYGRYIGMKRPNYLNQIRNIIAKAENGVSMYADPRKGTDAAERFRECLMCGLNNQRNITTATLTVTNMTSGATIIRSMMKLPAL